MLGQYSFFLFLRECLSSPHNHLYVSPKIKYSTFCGFFFPSLRLSIHLVESASARMTPRLCFFIRSHPPGPTIYNTFPHLHCARGQAQLAEVNMLLSIIGKKRAPPPSLRPSLQPWHLVPLVQSQNYLWFLLLLPAPYWIIHQVFKNFPCVCHFSINHHHPLV